jgi:hypothetical protein
MKSLLSSPDLSKEKSTDSDPDYLFTLFSKLPETDQNALISEYKSQLPELPLKYLLQQQSYIESALRWSPLAQSDDYRVEAASKYGGLTLLDSEVVSKIRSVGTEILKQLGKKLLSGNFNLTQISFPIRCMQASTALQNTLNTFMMVPFYITRAVAMNDPVERLKLVMISTLSSFVHTSTFEKPLNPILGETQHGLLEDGTELFSEQTSHHPPVSHFYIDGNGYKIHGYFNYTAKAGLNSVTVTNVGRRNFEFFDGYTAQITCPEEVFSGTFFGAMRHESLGTMTASDNAGNHCLINIGKIRGKPSDYLEGDLKNASGEVISKLFGSYLGYLEFDGVRYWDVRSTHPFKIAYTRRLLSDSESRRDIITLREGNIGEAQSAKEELENLQRLDRKLRGKHS